VVTLCPAPRYCRRAGSLGAVAQTPIATSALNQLTLQYRAAGRAFSRAPGRLSSHASSRPEINRDA
jgi:hypothetical protein